MKRRTIISTCVLGLLIVLTSGFFVMECQARQRGFYNEGYDKEVQRFDRVLANASDEELFLMLRLAIYKGYVPTGDIDPYHNIHAGVSSWHRTKMIYSTLQERNRYDLLSQIHPDKEALDEYVNGVGVRFEAHDQDTTQMNYLQKHRYVRGRKLYVIHEAIKQTLAPDSMIFESIADLPRTDLYTKYFGIPLMKK